MRKLLIPIQGDFIAPRFDLATEILILRFEGGTINGEPKTIILERPSEEGLCQLVVEENITDVICGGIEELHYKFLVWKKVTVLDAVIGDWQTAIERALSDSICQGQIFTNLNDKHLSL